MNPIIKFLGQKKSSYIRGILLCEAIGFLCFFILQFGIAILTSGYQEVPAYITDITQTTTLKKSGPRAYFKYTLHYYYNGQEYEKRFGSGDCPDSNLSKAWVSKDGSDVSPSSLSEKNTSAFYLLLVSIVSFVIWGFLYKRAPKINESDDMIALGVSVTGFFIAICTGIVIPILCFAMEFNASRATVRFTNRFIFIVLVIIFGLSLTIGIMAKLEEKRLDKIRNL